MKSQRSLASKTTEEEQKIKTEGDLQPKRIIGIAKQGSKEL